MRENNRWLNLDALSALLELSRRNGGFDAVMHGEIMTVLMSAFPFGADVSESERAAVLRQGITDAAARGPIDRRTLESSVRKHEGLLLAKPSKPFVLASNLSMDLFGQIRPTRFLGNIQLVRHLPQRFLTAREGESDRLSEDDRIVRNYLGTLVRVKARNPAHAFEIALDRIDLLRGIWNFSLNRGRFTGSHSDPTTPINRIRFSKIHTMHEPRGKLATTTYMFHPEFRLEDWPRLENDKWQRIIRFTRRVQQLLPRIQYRHEIERGLVHYCRALDATDMEAAFLKLWSVLEFISGVGGSNNDKVIARTAFLFKPDSMTRMLLEHLRFQRNEATHLGHPQSEMRPIVYQLKRYVEQMLAVHLSLGRHFASLEEAGQFMDLNQSSETLRRRVELISRALYFRREKATRRTQSVSAKKRR